MEVYADPCTLNILWNNIYNESLEMHIFKRLEGY